VPLNESIVEDAALEWFGEQRRVAPSLIPAFSHREKEAVGHGRRLAPGEHAEGTLTRPLPRGEEKRVAIQRLNPAIPEAASACAIHADKRATEKHYLHVRFERRLNP